MRGGNRRVKVNKAELIEAIKDLPDHAQLFIETEKAFVEPKTIKVKRSRITYAIGHENPDFEEIHIFIYIA
jgi:hypothetical protein